MIDQKLEFIQDNQKLIADKNKIIKKELSNILNEYAKDDAPNYYPTN